MSVIFIGFVLIHFWVFDLIWFLKEPKSKWDCLCHGQGSGRPPSDLQTHREDEAWRRLLRRGGEEVPLHQTGRGAAGRGERAEDLHRGGGVSQGGSSHNVFGKNVSLVGASRKDCALLYQNTETPAPAPISPGTRNRETWRLSSSASEADTSRFRLTIYVSKYFVKKENIWQWYNIIILYLSCCVSGLPVWRRGVGLKDCKGLKTIQVKLTINFSEDFWEFLLNSIYSQIFRACNSTILHLHAVRQRSCASSEDSFIQVMILST